MTSPRKANRSLWQELPFIAESFGDLLTSVDVTADDRRTLQSQARRAALVLDTATDEVYFSADEAAYKNAYVTVFQAWAKGTIKGTAEQIFEATKSILED
ncbi:hypothetical protein [Bradyrhizobium sp. Gha]|uniref:hypothetical protein n=1 Tax=Bradyrhizobium sp. Gha TaxID=1855318 RepID=UPI0008EACFC7|nr:hypothetical protein [Bradyrhizobium sp. Gha]SFJ73328.1 hypothetical protein SAMN05216525_13386 [Bradyrhizobium sp. Gha]